MSVDNQPIRFTDTHTHPYTDAFACDADAAMQRAFNAGVTRMILPNCSVDTIAPMRALAARYPQHTRMAMGIHPSDISADWHATVDVAMDELRSHRDDYVAVGEVGIDLYWDHDNADQQMQAFAAQLQTACELALPVIIHCREGLAQTLSVLQDFPEVRCNFHCFGGSVEDVRAIRRLGDHYFGIGGVVTFKNSGLAAVLPEIGIDRILLETDAPYLAPVPHRGKRNEPAYIPLTATRVADALGVCITEVAARTATNSEALFGF